MWKFIRIQNDAKFFSTVNYTEQKDENKKEIIEEINNKNIDKQINSIIYDKELHFDIFSEIIYFSALSDWKLVFLTFIRVLFYLQVSLIKLTLFNISNTGFLT